MIDGLRVAQDPTVARWITSGLDNHFATVASVVPTGYQAYARILHPARDESGKQTSWSAVAYTTGRQPHALMQWHALVGVTDPMDMSKSLWHGERPIRGSLDRETLETLCEKIALSTPISIKCYFCLWEGYGDLENYGWREDGLSDNELCARPGHVLSQDELRSPRLRLPDRNYVVIEGPLMGALQIGRWINGLFWHQSPNIFWPADRAWFVASEIDFDSTVVGGPVALIDDLVMEPRLDAWRVQPEDSLAVDGDTINAGVSNQSKNGTD